MFWKEGFLWIPQKNSEIIWSHRCCFGRNWGSDHSPIFWLSGWNCSRNSLAETCHQRSSTCSNQRILQTVYYFERQTECHRNCRWKISDRQRIPGLCPDNRPDNSRLGQPQSVISQNCCHQSRPRLDRQKLSACNTTIWLCCKDFFSSDRCPADLRCSGYPLSVRCLSCLRPVLPGTCTENTLWRSGMPREDIVSVSACYKKQREIMRKSTGIDTDLCGKCFAVCTYTKQYLKQKQ